VEVGTRIGLGNDLAARLLICLFEDEIDLAREKLVDRRDRLIEISRVDAPSEARPGEYL
jgi:hypothetical protein